MGTDVSWRSKREKKKTSIRHPQDVCAHRVIASTGIFNFALFLFVCLLVYFHCYPKIRNYYFQCIICKQRISMFDRLEHSL